MLTFRILPARSKTRRGELELPVRLGPEKSTSAARPARASTARAKRMAPALPDNGQLITCEIDAKAEAIARRYFAENPHGRKITVRMGPALDTIKTWTGPLDLVFIDADKVNYSTYYDACLPLLKSGGLVVAD